ncbi:hypothetical protein PtB15_14B449 [Puccinia triticina]|nr:hypothetical protein PtB15_14B449 [Puccinia triticina]
MVSILLILLLIGQYAAVNAVPGTKIDLPEGQPSGPAEYRAAIHAESRERRDPFSPPYGLPDYHYTREDELEMGFYRSNHDYPHPQDHPGRPAEHRTITPSTSILVPHYHCNCRDLDHRSQT